MGQFMQYLQLHLAVSIMLKKKSLVLVKYQTFSGSDQNEAFVILM